MLGPVKETPCSPALSVGSYSHFVIIEQATCAESTRIIHTTAREQKKEYASIEGELHIVLAEFRILSSTAHIYTFHEMSFQLDQSFHHAKSHLDQTSGQNLRGVHTLSTQPRSGPTATSPSCNLDCTLLWISGALQHIFST